MNNLGGNYETHRVGKRVIRRSVELESTGITDLGKWNRYTLDLATLIQAEPGAIYQIRLSFKKAYSTYACENTSGESTEIAFEDELPEDWDYSGNEYYDYDYYYYEDYDWEQRDNPCHTSYYRPNRDVVRNVLASDLGLLAKRGDDGHTTVVVTDLKSAQPLSGVTVELYDFQHQVVAVATT